MDNQTLILAVKMKLKYNPIKRDCIIVNEDQIAIDKLTQAANISLPMLAPQLNNKLLKAGKLIGGHIFNKDNELALMLIQYILKIKVDGILGPVTWAKLFKEFDKLIKGKKNLLNTYIDNKHIMAIHGFETPIYDSQRDNIKLSSKSCNVSALSSILSVFGLDISGDKLYEEIDNIAKELTNIDNEHYKKYNSIFRKHRPHTVVEVLQKAALRHMVLSKYEHKGKLGYSFPQLISANLTGSGHFVALYKMYSINGKAIIYEVHDPWGDWKTKYKNHNGKSRLYEAKILQRLTKYAVSFYQPKELVKK